MAIIPYRIEGKGFPPLGGGLLLYAQTRGRVEMEGTMAVATRARTHRASGGHKVVKTKEVQQLLNGQPTGVVIPEPGQTIGAVAMEMARSNGLKTYSILVDGVKVTTEGAGKPLAGAKSIEIFAKETRG